jgi:sugar phosphate isomerase/epimerase
MIEEILDMGFGAVELGYDTRLDLIEGIRAMVDQGAVKVNSLHNYCPLPMGAPRGHPELYTLGDPDPRVRANAVTHTKNTIEFAAEIGATKIVSHAGYVSTKKGSDTMIRMIMAGTHMSPKYDKYRMKFMMERDKKTGKHLTWLYDGLAQLLPTLETHGVAIALENLPTWEALPTETEIEAICAHFDSPYIRYWHDMGHGQIRENLGFINHDRWAHRLEPVMAGMHVHDVSRRISDHTMPPLGEIDFTRFGDIANNPDILKVIEPTTKTPREEIVAAHEFLQQVWSTDSTETESTDQPSGDE